MLFNLLILLLISNAVTTRRDKTILFSRVVITSLLFSSILAFNNLDVLALDNGIGLYGGLFNVTSFTQTFNIFIFLISSVILILTAFYPRKIFINKLSSPYSLLNKLIYNKNTISNKNGEQFRIIEYSLIIIFVLTGAVFLMSSADLISIFLAIELQSYGLYILSTLYKDSEYYTASQLMSIKIFNNKFYGVGSNIVRKHSCSWETKKYYATYTAKCPPIIHKVPIFWNEQFKKDKTEITLFLPNTSYTVFTIVRSEKDTKKVFDIFKFKISLSRICKHISKAIILI